MASTSLFHPTGAPRLILAKRTKPLPLPPNPTPLQPSRRPSSSLSSSSSSSSSSSTSLSTQSPSIQQTPKPKWASNWRSGGPPKSVVPPAKPSFQCLLEGQVLFLGTPPSSSMLWLHPQLSAPQDHPVVVVGKFKSQNGEDCVRLRTITSFGGVRLQDKKPERQWPLYMLCENTQDKPDLTQVAFAKAAPGTGVFSKRCYVNLSANSIFEVEYKHLEVFVSHPWLRFDTLSTQYIKNAPAIL